MQSLKTKLVVALGFFCLGLAIVCLWPSGIYSCQLSDGTQPTLSGPKIGRTNTYFHGTFLSRTFAAWIPSKGISLGPVKLVKPLAVTCTSYSDIEILSAQIRISGGTNLGAILRRGTEADGNNITFYRKRRLVLSGDDGFSFINNLPVIGHFPDGDFWHFQAEVFPRASKLLRLRLEERENVDSHDWKTCFSLEFPNPKPSVLQKWKPTDASATRVTLTEVLEAQIGGIEIRRGTEFPKDIWENTVVIPVRITRGGELLTNWGMSDITLTDASGNRAGFSGVRILTNGWLEYRGLYTSTLLNPHLPWQLKANIAQHYNFPATEMHFITIPAVLGTTVLTNLAGLPVRINFGNVPPGVGVGGSGFVLAYPQMMQVELPAKPPDWRLSSLEVKDDQGKRVLGYSWGGEGKHLLWKYGTTRYGVGGSPPNELHITIAIHPNYPHEFILQPHLEL